jgi:hypothetical protein
MMAIKNEMKFKRKKQVVLAHVVVVVRVREMTMMQD